jgi:hypothetical protein
MYNNKAQALTFAFLFSLSHGIWAEEGEDPGQEQAPAEETSTAEEVAVGPASEAPTSAPAAAISSDGSEVGPGAVESDTAATQSAAPEKGHQSLSGDDAMREHWKAREEQYQALRKRAEEAGVMLPESPPWRSEMGQMMPPSMEERMAQRKKMMSMSEEERNALRQQHYEEMRAQAGESGVEMPETPPWVARQQAMNEEWAKHQKVIEGMSDEERAACHAMHRRHMGMRNRGGMGQGCGMGHQGCGMHQGDYAPRMAPGYGPGYGYGYAPAPYGPQNFWDPNQ